MYAVLTASAFSHKERALISLYVPHKSNKVTGFPHCVWSTFLFTYPWGKRIPNVMQCSYVFHCLSFYTSYCNTSHYTVNADLFSLSFGMDAVNANSPVVLAAVAAAVVAGMWAEQWSCPESSALLWVPAPLLSAPPTENTQNTHICWISILKVGAHHLS